MAEEIITFDEILSDPHYKAEFDRRVTKALSTVQAKLDKEVQKVKELSEKVGGDGETIEDVKKQLTELQAKYDADTKALQGQLADRDYSDAIESAITGGGLKFSSKSAKQAFVATVKEKKPELKDGKLNGFDDLVKAHKEADPEAFAPDKAPPRVVGPMGGGSGGHSTAPKTVAEQLAENIGKASAESGKAANNIISMYTGGKT